tara:strand:+ start:3214 stop:5316 length:2103 start_codon:yes stop_codon:yes gene_type:complete
LSFILIRTTAIFFFILNCLALFANQQEVFHVNTIERSKHLAKHAEILKDANHQFQFKDILSPSDSLKEQFFTADSDIPYMDFTSSTYWMRIQLRNDTTIPLKLYIELARPLTNKVNLYVFNSNKELIEVFYAGDELAFKDRPYQHRKFIFPVSFPAQETLWLVAETESDGEILKLPFKLWKIEEFTQFASKEHFYLGLYYGLFIIVVILFSFFGLALRQNLYLYFVVYVFVLGVFQLSLDGLAYKFLWPCFPWVGNHAILAMAAISMTFMLIYVKKFLEFDKQHKNYLRVYNGFIVLVLLSLAASLTSGVLYQFSYPVLNGLSFISILYILYGLYLKYKSDEKPDVPVLMAFIGLVVGAILFITTNTNFINSEFLASNALKLGSATEVFFLSIAMANRYRKTQIEKIEAQEIAFKRLQEVDELRREQNEKLEIQVKERTEEIRHQNDILSEQNRDILNSINYAKRLQDAILPSKSDLVKELINPSVLYLPKDIVSGDFYWMEATEEHVFFAVADCTGHGVPGALVSVVGHNALNRCIKELKLTDPGKILDELTLIVEATFAKENTKVSDGMDIALCVWDRKSSLKYAGAFNPLYLIRNNDLIEYKGNKQPIGKFITRNEFDTQEITLEKGDAIYLFSDGYADQFGGPKGKKLKYSQFKNYLLELNLLNGKVLSEELEQRLKAWMGAEEQIDDVCLLKVQF